MAAKIEKESKDCLACRLVTGFGVVGVGIYIYVQAKNRRKFETHTMRFLAAGTVGIGIARLLNVEFLKARNDN